MMYKQTTLSTVNYILMIFISPVLITACGGSGDGSAGNLTPHTEQNLVYINKIENNRIMAARDDGSLAPFTLVSVTGGDAFGLRVSPDSEHVAYKIIDNNNTVNLYVSHSNGAYNTQLTNLPSGRSVTDVDWSPDGSRLVYLADANTAGKYELFMTTAAFDSSTNISSSNVIISGTIVSSTSLDIDSPKWSGDGSKVAYLVTDSARSTVNDVIGLNYHDTAIGARHSVRLSTPLSFPGFQDIDSYRWSPDGKRLAYISNPGVDTGNYLYEIDFDSGSLIPDEMAPATNYHVTDIAYSADSQYLASIHINTSDEYRLKIDNVVSGANINTLDTTKHIRSMKWSRQAPVLAYRIGDFSTRIYSLKYSALNSGVYNAFLHNSATTSENALGYQWSHGDNRLVLTTLGISTFDTKLKVHNVSAGGVITVAGPLASGRNFDAVRWSQDDQRIAFSTNQAGCKNSEIHSSSSTSIDIINLDDNICSSGFVY